jgi:hypothetical protein
VVSGDDGILHKMKKIGTWFLVFLLFINLIQILIPTVKASPSTWYVATTGSDTTGDGSIGNPYATLRKAINRSSNCDTIYMRGGDYNTNFSIKGIFINRSGTLTSPFIISSYPGETAIINGSNTVLYRNPSTHVTYGLFNISRSGGIYVHDIIIQDITFKNSNRFAIRIDVTDSGATGACRNMTVKGCTFINISAGAVSFIDTKVATGGNIDNVRVSNCTFNGIALGYPSWYAGECVDFIGCRNFTADYNTVLYFKYIFFELSGGSIYGSLHHNIVHANRSQAFYFEPADNNNKTVCWITMYDNMVWGAMDGSTDLSLVLISNEVTGDVIHNITIYNNILNASSVGSAHTANGIKIRQQSGSVIGTIDDITVKFNTIYVHDTTVDASPVFITYNIGLLHRCVFTNNIFICKGNPTYVFKALFYNSTDTTMINRFNNLYYHFSKTTKDDWYDGTTKFEASKVLADPQLVSLLTYNFHLNQTSPAMDAASGTYTVSTDYDGIPRPAYAGYDIGAYEYNEQGSGDSIAPVISQVVVGASSPIDTLIGYGWENFTCTVTDNVGVSTVILKFLNPNESTTNVLMIKKIGTSIYYSNRSLQLPGNYSYFIQANDTSNNVAFSSNDMFSLPPNWDINNDGVETILDLVLVSNHYGENGYNGWIREDVDNNGVVQILDMILISDNYGSAWWV